jgi:hypothetical protein
MNILIKLIQVFSILKLKDKLFGVIERHIGIVEIFLVVAGVVALEVLLMQTVTLLSMSEQYINHNNRRNLL